jgi:hypothetical protein
MRLEILNEIDGVSFEECYRYRRRSRVGNLRVNFIALRQLLRNKRASGRQKDLADVEALTVKMPHVYRARRRQRQR